MANQLIRIGPNRLEVDDKEASSISINFSLKDIKNFGQRNASFTKPVSVLQTTKTDKIFKSLFNINITGGYDTSKKVYAEIIEDGLTVMSGSLQVVDITEDTYEVVISSDNLNMFDDLGDKLVIGNLNPVNDISWDGTPFQHTWSRDKIREELNSTPTHDGTGYIYPIIKYDEKLEWPGGIVPRESEPLIDDYYVFPAIAYKQIFDRILEKYGFTYEMSASIEEPLKELYIPFNDDYLNYTTPSYLYGKYYLGNPTVYEYEDTTVELTFLPYKVSFFNSEYQPINSVKGWCFEDSYLGGSNVVSGGYDYIRKAPSDDEAGVDWGGDATGQRFPLPHKGSFIIDVSMYLFNTNATETGTTEWSISTWNEIDGLVTTNIGDSLDIGPATGGYISESITVNVSSKSYFYIHRSTESSGDINLIFGPWSNVQIRELNSLIGEAPVFDLNNMLPRNYKQSDIINDVFKMFNCFVTVDSVDKKKLYIQTYEDFYASSVERDWSKKIDNSSIKIKPIKNSFAKSTNFKFVNDSDIYTQDYLAKFPDGIYTNYVDSGSDFGSAENNIILSTSPGTLDILPNSEATNPLYNGKPITGLEVLNLTDDKQFKTAWKPRVLFSSTVDISAFPYGSDRDNVASGTITKWTTLSPRRYADTTDEDNVFMAWNSENTYLDRFYETNESLYNKFYRADILNNLNDDSRLLTADFRLNPNDIQEGNFNDRIWIDNSKIGSAWYYINSINGYVPGSNELTEVELIKIEVEPDSDYPAQTGTNIIYRSLTGDGDISTSSVRGTGSGSSVVVSSSNLQEVTEIGNQTDQGIVFNNPSVVSSQVGLSAGQDNNLMLNGSLLVSDNLTVEEDASIYGDLSVTNVNASGDGIFGNLQVDGVTQLVGNSYHLDYAYFHDIARFNDELQVDNQQSLSTFVSGFTGQGFEIKKDAEDNYRAEFDDLLVRGSLTAYEMILHKIRSLNGNLWISSAVEAVYSTDTSTAKKAGYWFDSSATENSQYNWFYTDALNNSLVTGDAIRSQQFTGNGIHQEDLWVVDASNDKIWVSHLNDVNDGLGEPGAIADKVAGMVSINATVLEDAYDFPYTGYDFYMTAGQAIKTNNFELKGGQGKVMVGWGMDAPYGGSGAIQIALFDENDNQISGSISVPVGTNSWYRTDYLTLNEHTFNGGEAYLKAYCGIPTDGYGWYIDVLMDHTLDSEVDVTNWTFVRMGHPTDESRQGALYLTADDSNAPYLEILDGMTSHDIKAENRKARLGNLNGLEYEGLETAGYGLWSENCYLNGTINSVNGNIGGWNITNNSLEASASNGSIYLNANGPYISVSDLNNTERIKFTAGDLTRPENLIGADYLEWLDASCGGAELQVDLSTGTNSGVKSRFIQRSGSLVYDYISDQGTAYHFNPTPGKEYSFNYAVDVSVAALDSSPSWKYNQGYFNMDLTLTVYNDSDEVLYTETKEYNFLGVNKYPINFKSNLGIIEDNVYFKLTYYIKNSLYYSDGGLNSGFSGTYRFILDTKEITFDGADGKTEISSQGLVVAWDNDQYLAIDGSTANTLEDPFIASDGAWEHKGLFRAPQRNYGVTTITANYTADPETDEVIVLTGSYSRNLTIPNDWPIGKKLVIVNATHVSNVNKPLNIYGDSPTSQTLFAGGSQGGYYNLSPGDNIYQGPGSTPYALESLRTMEIIKISTSGWSWLLR